MTVRKINHPLIIADIIGNGYVHARVNKTNVDFPSVVGLSQTSFSATDFDDRAVSKMLTWNDATFVWGEETFRSSRLQNTAMGSEKLGQVTHRRLLIASLYELFGAQDITPDILVTTTPVLYYDNDREKMRNMLAGDYHIMDSNGAEFIYSISPDVVKILPEGLPTVTDMIFSNNLNVIPKRAKLLEDNARIGVVNTGTFTTDLIYVEDQLPVSAKCTSIDTGLFKIWEELKRVAKIDHGRTLSNHEADSVMKSRILQVGKQQIPMDTVIENMCEAVAEEIAEAINREWDNGRAITDFIEAGGGGPILHDYLAHRYENVVNYHYYPTISEAAATETNGAWKVAHIKMAQEN